MNLIYNGLFSCNHTCYCVSMSFGYQHSRQITNEWKRAYYITFCTYNTITGTNIHFKYVILALLSNNMYEANISYVGHPISSDNDFISQKLFLKSEFYYPLHVAMGIAYSCLKYGGCIPT